MATTTAPLIWSHYREVADVSGLGGLIHYYDEQSQSIYLTGGDITTRVADVPEGHWREVIQGSPIVIHDDSFTRMRLDHPSNGTLYGVATDGASLTFLRYVYAMDISDLADSWSWMSQNDNPIAQSSAAIQNIGPDVFSTDATLFQPGARIITSITIGGSQPYPIGLAWLDECSYDISGELVDLSGRNTVGYYLKDQTFDDYNSFTGVSHEVLADILTYAGVTKFKIQPGEGVLTFQFKPEDSILDGIAAILSIYSTPDNEYQMVELPDGEICIGYQWWVAQYQSNSYYSFNEGSDVFKRKTNKLIDSSYTALRVTGKDANDADLTPITVPVKNFPFWSLGKHRTQHLKAPDGLTQSGLQDWAQAQALKYQYIGIGEDFVAPFRPQLLVGDVAEVVEGNQGITLGVITEVRQVFTRRDGFKTEFSVDSGGVVTDGSNYTIYSRAAEVSGFNRRQRVVDLVRYIAKK